jgi:hypothetical protein
MEELRPEERRERMKKRLQAEGKLPADNEQDAESIKNATGAQYKSPWQR